MYINSKYFKESDFLNVYFSFFYVIINELTQKGDEEYDTERLFV